MEPLVTIVQQTAGGLNISVNSFSNCFSCRVFEVTLEVKKERKEEK